MGTHRPQQSSTAVHTHKATPCSVALKTDDESHKTTRAHKAHGSWHMGLLMRVMHKITSYTTPRKTSTSTQEHGHDAQSMHDDATRSTREGGSEETRGRRPDTNAEEVGALACALRVPVRITRPRHASECDKHLEALRRPRSSPEALR